MVRQGLKVPSWQGHDPAREPWHQGDLAARPPVALGEWVPGRRGSRGSARRSRSPRRWRGRPGSRRGGRGGAGASLRKGHPRASIPRRPSARAGGGVTPEAGGDVAFRQRTSASQATPMARGVNDTAVAQITRVCIVVAFPSPRGNPELQRPCGCKLRSGSFGFPGSEARFRAPPRENRRFSRKFRELRRDTPGKILGNGRPIWDNSARKLSKNDAIMPRDWANSRRWHGFPGEITEMIRGRAGGHSGGGGVRSSEFPRIHLRRLDEVVTSLHAGTILAIRTFLSDHSESPRVAILVAAPGCE